MSKAIKKITKATLDVVTLGQADKLKGIAENITGITAAKAAEEQRKLAAQTAKEQQAAIAKQDKLIEDKRRQQQKISDERKGRLSQNLLLSGEQTGTTKKNTLLGAK